MVDGGGRRHRRREVWMFCKAQLSAWLASVVDFLVTISLVKFGSLFYLYATFIGSVVGGVTNCVINYGWVFHADGCNTWGTFALTEWVTGMGWMERLPAYYADNMFIVSKMLVAVTVAFFWNYSMQRTFVYRNLNFRRIFRKRK